MKTKTISMKKLYQWASDYGYWKRLPENNNGSTDEGISNGIYWINDYLKMIWEKRREERGIKN
jgi:hypothetical protein